MRKIISIRLCSRSGPDRSLLFRATPWYFAAALHNLLTLSGLCGFKTRWCGKYYCRLSLVSFSSVCSTFQTYPACPPCQWFPCASYDFIFCSCCSCLATSLHSPPKKSYFVSFIVESSWLLLCFDCLLLFFWLSCDIAVWSVGLDIPPPTQLVC